MNNEVLKTIINRRSIRKFNDTPVSEEILANIVDSGRWAPTGGNCQSIHFTVITNQEVLENLRTTVKTAFATMEPSEDQYISIQRSIAAARKGEYVYDYGAPILIVVSNVKGYPNAIADSACALQNMMLTATSFGVGSCWINQLHWLEENELVRKALAPLGIHREETICGALALGNFDGEFGRLPRKGMQVDYIR